MEQLDLAIELARAAGDVLKHYMGRDKQIEFKGRANLVTVADKESEALIIRGISDYLDDKGKADAANGQQIAAQHASAFAFEVIAHEWTHHYLYFFPLGLDYNDSGEIRTINETTAKMMVFLKRGMMSSRTGRCVAGEVPQSPVAKSFNQVA